MSNYAIGNSLTDDCAVQAMPGWGYHLRGGSQLSGMFNGPDEPGDAFFPARWPDAFAAQQYDYVSYQPYQQTAQNNADTITQWCAIETDGVVVIHDHPPSRDVFEEQYHAIDNSEGHFGTASKIVADETHMLVGQQNPGRVIRETNCADCMDAIFHDVARPFAFNDLYRDGTHMSFDRGRFLLNNLMRASFRLPFIRAAEFQTLTGNSPDAVSEAYLLSMANQFTPGYFEYTGGLNMLGYGYGNPGADYDFYAFDAEGLVWNNVSMAFESFADPFFVDYRIAATTVGSSGRYRANLPDGTVSYDMRVRGGTLVESFVIWSADFPTASTGGGSVLQSPFG